MDLIHKLKRFTLLILLTSLILSGCSKTKTPGQNPTGELHSENEAYSTVEISEDYDNTDWEKIAKSSYDQIKNIMSYYNWTFDILVKEAYNKNHPPIDRSFTSGENQYDNSFEYNYRLAVDSTDTFIVNEFNQYIGYKGPTSGDVVIPNGPTAILNSFFMVRPERNNLNSITIPESIKYIDINMFSGGLSKNIFVDEKNEIYADIDGVLCNKNKDILLCYPRYRETEKYILPESIKYIEYRCFQNAKIKELVLNDNITEIPGVSFTAAEIDILEIPSSVKKINKYGFRASYIKNFKFSEGLKEIEAEAFDHCEKIEEIVLPKGLKKLGDQAFNSCYNLKKIYIPKSVESIDGILYDEKKSKFEMNPTIYVEMNSYAEKYVKEKGYKFEYYTDDTDLW